MKKLTELDLKLQLAGVFVLLLLVGFAGYSFVVAPESAKAQQIQGQIEAVQTQIVERNSQLHQSQHEPVIQTAELFRLDRAMPQREDMPGIILALSDVARASGITFNLIEPATGTAPPSAGSYTTERIHLRFNGDFYGLSDFLYRLRTLVAIHNGTLYAGGRLFDVDTITFTVSANQFPQISAELYVDAFIYGSSGGTTAAPPATTTTPDSSSTSDSSLPSSGATASGAVGG